MNNSGNTLSEYSNAVSKSTENDITNVINSTSNYTDTPNTLTRFHLETSTCDINNLYSDFLNGIFGRFQDSYFYTFVIQFIIVSLMYCKVGKGKYWKILFYAAVVGLMGSILENSTVAVICLKSNEQKTYSMVPSFLVCEVFWILSEYAIPYLNLIKMEAFIQEHSINYTKYILILLFIPFTICRFLIGYERMKSGYLQSPLIHTYHGYAFSAMALADIICTISILYYLRSSNLNRISTAQVLNDYIKQSSYTILIAVDVVSTFLSILNILTNIGPFTATIPNNIIKPLHCLKCSFILILAADALLFKYGANVSTIQESVGTNSKTYRNELESINSFGYNNSNKGTPKFLNCTISDMTSMTNNSSKRRSGQTTLANYSPYNYPSMESGVNGSNYNRNKRNHQSCIINVSPYNYSSPSMESETIQNVNTLKNYYKMKGSEAMHKHSYSDGERIFNGKAHSHHHYGHNNHH